MEASGSICISLFEKDRCRHSCIPIEIKVKQVWVAVSVYVLAKIAKKQLGLELSLHKILHILAHGLRVNSDFTNVLQLQRRVS